ncbi:MAG: hypothetical protein V4506_16005 [Bacteroidota bacterium]
MEKSTKVKSYLHACKILKRTPKIPKSYTKRFAAIHMLEMIYEATNFINNKWKVNFLDTNQQKWFVWLRHNGLSGKRAGFVFCLTGYHYTCTGTGLGSRLFVSSDDEATYLAKKFPKLHSDSAM